MSKGEFFLVLLLVVFWGMLCYDGCNGCNTTHKKQHWVVTGKEYQQGGMCCDGVREKKFYAVVIVAHNKHRHKYEASKFIIHTGKPYSHDYFETDSLSFYTRYRVSQRLIY